MSDKTVQPTVTEIAGLVQRLTITFPHESKRAKAVREGLCGDVKQLPLLIDELKAVAKRSSSPNARHVAAHMLDRIKRLNVCAGTTIGDAYKELGMTKLGKDVNDMFKDMGVSAVRIGKRTLKVTP